MIRSASAMASILASSKTTPATRGLQMQAEVILREALWVAPNADRLRELLMTPDEAAELDAPGNTDAAVLVPLFVRGDELHAVFTKRRDDLRRHAGEISFPGGRQDFPDEDLRVTALREAEEEIGLPRDDVELIGALPPTGTFVTGYRIHPFVGVIRRGHAWTPQPNEVEQVLELSLRALVEGYENKRL